MTNFDSAWFLYGALFLLLATSFVVRIDYARVGLAAAAFVALPLTLFRGSDLGYSLLVLAILAVNIGILARLWLRGTNISFSAEEEALRREHFTGLGAGAARDLIDQGHWISAKRGEVLIRENQAAPSLFYLAEGQAAVLRDGVEVGKLSGGALIGEATVLGGAAATATVTLTAPSRFWCAQGHALNAYLAANPDARHALEHGFTISLRDKLEAMNRAAAPTS